MLNRLSVRLSLTRDQQDQVRQATGKSAEAIELSVEELEERIAPMTRAAPSPIPLPYPNLG